MQFCNRPQHLEQCQKETVQVYLRRMHRLREVVAPLWQALCASGIVREIVGDSGLDAKDGEVPLPKCGG